MVQAATVDLGILNDTAIAKVEERLSDQTKDILAGYMTQIEQAQKEAMEIRDPKKRAEALGLVKTRFADVKLKIDADRTDMSDVVLAFSTYARQLDDQIEELFKESPAQKARKAAAAKRVHDARTEMEVAPTRSTLFGMRDPVAVAKEELAQADAALIEVNAEVAREIDKEAHKAGINESLSRLLVMGERAYTALVEGHRIMAARTATIRADKEKSFEVAKKTKEMIVALDLKITELQSQYESAKDVLDHASQDDANYVELTQSLSRLEADLQTASANRSALLLVSREEQINAQEYTGYERSAIAMTGDAKALAAAQQTKNRNIAQKRAHYIETMEQLKKIELAATSLKTGNEVERRLLDTLLEAGAASTNARQDFQQDQPERLTYVQNRLEEQEEQRLHSAGIDKKTREDFARRFLGGKGAPDPAA